MEQSKSFSSAIDAISQAHCPNFAAQWRSPLIEYAKKLSPGPRKCLFSEIASGDKNKRYARFSEIAMHSYLSRHFFSVECPQGCCDFFLPRERVHIEVVTPTPGDDPELCEFTRDYHEDVRLRGIPCDNIVRRYWDAISAKIEYVRDHEIPKNHSVVIAISSILLSDFPNMALGHNDYNFPYIVRAVVPVGGGIFWIDTETGEEGVGHAKQAIVLSLGGKPREKSYFCSAAYSDISAVIAFAPDEDWFDDWKPICIRNPFARMPISNTIFPNPLARYEISTLRDGFELSRLL